jgi:O-antigen ligase
VIYQTSNAVALFLLPVIAVAASIAAYGQDQRARLLSGGYLVLAVPAFLLTFSRGGYLALLGVGLGLAIAHRRRWRLLAIALAITVLFALIPPITTRLAHELNFSGGGNNTLVGRSYLWRATLQMLEHYPITGAGLAGFETRLAPYWNPTHTDRFIYPHNLILNFWSETGLLGLAAFLWLLIAAFQVSWHGWKNGASSWRAIHLGVLLALTGIVIHGLVDVPYFKNDLSLEFWTLLAITWAGLRWGSEGAPQPVRDTARGATRPVR